MKTAVIQLSAGGSKQKNLAKALRLVRQAAIKKAKFVLLPEAFNFRGKVDPHQGYSDIAERFPGPSTKPLIEIAKKYKIFILAGSICEAIPGRKKVFNTSALINAQGRIVAKYRKMNLFSAQIGKTKVNESRRIARGKKTVTTTMGPWKIGMSICYDLRFPALYKKYSASGASILCVPSAFTKLTGQAHWEVLLRARAIENACYVLAPNQIGKDGQGIDSYGNSMIVDPWGKILARASNSKEEIVYADLERSAIKKFRRVISKLK